MFQHDRPAVLVPIDDHHDFRVSGRQFSRLAQRHGIRESEPKRSVSLTLTDQIEPDERMNIPRPADLPQIHFESWDRLCIYAVRAGKELRRQLGWGYEGLVYVTSFRPVIRAYRHINLYENERNV